MIFLILVLAMDREFDLRIPLSANLGIVLRS
jgi:hypothetical protein